MPERLIIAGDIHIRNERFVYRHLENLIDYAANTQAQLILNGDTVESLGWHTRRVLSFLFQSFTEYHAHTGKTVVLLRGNHDSALEEEDFFGRFGLPDDSPTSCLHIQNGAFAVPTAKDILIYHGHQNPNLLNHTRAQLLSILYQGSETGNASAPEKEFRMNDFALLSKKEDIKRLSPTTSTSLRLSAFLGKNLVVIGHDHRQLLERFILRQSETGATSDIVLANGGIFKSIQHSLAVEIDQDQASVRLINNKGDERAAWLNYKKLPVAKEF